MGEENPIVYLLGGGGLAIILVAFVKGAWDYLRGRHDREIAQSKDRRDTITALKEDVRDAEREADQERTERLAEQRKAGAYWEAYAQFRQHVIREHHIDPDSLPPWPTAE